MKSFRAKIKFNHQSVKFLRFPIYNSFRISIWFHNLSGSFPSEISSNEPLTIEIEYIVMISVINMESIPVAELVHSTFEIGMYPGAMIAKGEIINMY